MDINRYPFVVEIERETVLGAGGACLAPTGAERRPRTLEVSDALLAQKNDIPLGCHSFVLQSARRDSNPRPRPWQGRAPPTEPLAHKYDVLFINTIDTLS